MPPRRICRPPIRLSTTPHDDFEGLDIIMWRMRIIPPNSWFRSSWDWVLIMFVLYNLVSIPIEICFPYITPTPLAIFNFIENGPTWAMRQEITLL